jgi:sporulation protein YlmC with PRC-barrel domain
MAQSAPAGQQNASGFITQLGPDAMLVSDLMDQDVVGPDNKEIGEVDDVILDRNGRVIALVIEADEGIGDRTVAAPMSAIQMNAADATTTGSVQGSGQASGGSAARNSSDDMRIVLNIPAEQLKSAPEFDEDND